tara:strand:+ start:96 stop:284 length:189 start_codon:yes stop_codon:yes gene_type:complete
MKLAQFLKYQGLVSTGGEAKVLINSRLISVNGSVVTEKGRKIYPGDVISFDNQEFIVSQSIF